jgi:hypothetical protein
VEVTKKESLALNRATTAYSNLLLTAVSIIVALILAFCAGEGMLNAKVTASNKHCIVLAVDFKTWCFGLMHVNYSNSYFKKKVYCYFFLNVVAIFYVTGCAETYSLKGYSFLFGYYLLRIFLLFCSGVVREDSNKTASM